MLKDKITRRKNRKKRSIIKGTKIIPRVVLSESNKYLRVQAIDDEIGNTIIYFSTEFIDDKKISSKKNKDYAKLLGELFARELMNKGKKKIVFDRNSRIYVGKVKVFCETMRELGINF